MLLLGAIHLLNPPQHYFKPLSGEKNFKHLEILEYKRKKRAEKKKTKESREAKDKSYEDYLWTELCEDVTKLKKLRIPELNKYLNTTGWSCIWEQQEWELANQNREMPGHKMTTGQVLRAVKWITVTVMSMTVMPSTLGEKITQVVLFLHSSIHTREMPMTAITRRSEIDPRLTSYFFDLCFCFFFLVLCSIGIVKIVFIVSTIT